MLDMGFQETGTPSMAVIYGVLLNKISGWKTILSFRNGTFFWDMLVFGGVGVGQIFLGVGGLWVMHLVVSYSVVLYTQNGD